MPKRFGEGAEVVCYQESSARRAMRDGVASINLKEEKLLPPRRFAKPLAHIILGEPLREPFGKQVKTPLRKALITYASGKASWLRKIIAFVRIIRLCKKYPLPTRDNCYYGNTFVLMDIWDRFFKKYYNPDHIPLFQAMRDLTCAEMEHDIHYAWLMNWFVEELIKEVDAGNFILNDKTKPFPQEKCWKE